MQKSKREEFLEGINAGSGIHTMSIVADEVDKKKAHDCVNVSEPVKRKDKYCMKVNVNKGAVYYSEKGIITCFSQFLEILLLILSQIGAVGVRLTRADFAINMFGENDYYKYEKPISLVIRCIGYIEHIVDNCYHSNDMNTKTSLTNRIGNYRMQIENYNKFEQAKGTVPATNRLELRSTSIRTLNEIDVALYNEFMITWITRFKKITNEVFEAVQKECNDVLIWLYEEDVQKPKQERQYISLSAFLLANQEMIYTRQQLRDLYRALEPNCNAESKTKKFFERHKIETYSKKDLKIIRDGIIKEIERFFQS